MFFLNSVLYKIILLKIFYWDTLAYAKYALILNYFLIHHLPQITSVFKGEVLGKSQ